jgi:inner membrane protein YidH
MAQPLEQSGKKLARSAERIEHSTTRVEHSTARVEDSADRRTVLAADRTVLAAERTYGAWVRTGLLALASGLGAKAGLAGVVPEWMIIADGSVLVLFSAFCFMAAVWRQLNPGPPPPVPDAPRIPPFILIGVNGFLALISVTALFGIWFGRTGGH